MLIKIPIKNLYFKYLTYSAQIELGIVYNARNGVLCLTSYFACIYMYVYE